MLEDIETYTLTDSQAPNPSITVALPLIASFPAAQSPTPVPGGKRREITYTVPGTNVSLIATLGTPQDASPIPITAYEYTVGSMRYYIAAKLNTTGDLPLNSTQDPFFWDIGYGAWLEFNSNPSPGPLGPNHLTYSVIVAALDGIKVGLLEAGWYDLAFIEIMNADAGLVGMATVAPNQAPFGSSHIQNIDDALNAMNSAVEVTPVDGGEAH